VSTAVNDGVESLFAGLELTKLWGPGRTTVVASSKSKCIVYTTTCTSVPPPCGDMMILPSFCSVQHAHAIFFSCLDVEFFHSYVLSGDALFSVIVGMARMILMPIDTAKTVLQVDSAEGFRNLMRRVKAGRITVLYEGALAAAFAAIIGHYPWFFTYSTLQASAWVHKLIPSKLLANAAIGFLAAVVSDIVTNAARVVKTTKQSLASKHNIGYAEIIRMVVAADGWHGLFGRGLRTRILTNALQSVMFTVLWRGLAERWQQQQEQRDDSGDGETDSKRSQTSAASA
jgi:Mitochondrial carrier protein